MKKTQLQALLDHAISDSPDKTAIHFKTHSYSYLVPERKVSFLKKHHTQSTIIFSDLA